MTNTVTYGNTDAVTGLWLSEATDFVNEVTKAGYSVDYVSPKGGYVPIDPRSLKALEDETVELYKNREFQKRALAESAKPEDLSSSDYVAVYYTGGHGVMWDFTDNNSLDKISRQIYEDGGYLTSVCHGIAGLLNLKDSDGNYIIKGKNITGFTDSEEKLSGKSSVVPFSNEKVAEEHGANFKKKMPFTVNVIQDGRIITGQNPQSPKEVADILLENLSKN